MCDLNRVQLGDLLDYEQPTRYIVSSTDYDDAYDTPVLTAGQTFILGYTNETEGIYKASKSNPVIIFDDFVTSFYLVDFDFKVKSSALKILKPKKSVNIYYVYYAMLGINFVPKEHTRHWISKYSLFEIAYPSFAKQQEIVSHLDTFTTLISNLESELDMRRKQYEHYRNQLLDFEGVEGVEWKKIGSITRVFSASRVHKNEWTNEGVPFWRSSDLISFFNNVENPKGKAFISYELYENLSAKSGKISKDDILVTGGGTIGIPYIVPDDNPLYVKDADLLCIVHNDAFVSKYLFQYMLCSDFRNYLSSLSNNATIAHYTITQINDTIIPLPSKQTQQEIVEKLDAFENLIQSLEHEIKLRKQQYEYYREKLLTFD